MCDLLFTIAFVSIILGNRIMFPVSVCITNMPTILHRYILLCIDKRCNTFEISTHVTQKHLTYWVQLAFLFRHLYFIPKRWTALNNRLCIVWRYRFTSSFCRAQVSFPQYLVENHTHYCLLSTARTSPRIPSVSSQCLVRFIVMLLRQNHNPPTVCISPWEILSKSVHRDIFILFWATNRKF